ncbi:hypothetical protein L3X38_033232 [Prunus dulcis]|uniref:Uncharacterized protein n=1 Tax=Prunus dulcis TaxID=3755 RepID=A0AAD4YWS3_PRUDU|nr:hypothetical protein L3X38_033232 [Prunus dulcis]
MPSLSLLPCKSRRSPESSLFFLALSLPEIKSIIEVIAEEVIEEHSDLCSCGQLEAKAAAFGAYNDVYDLRESNKVIFSPEANPLVLRIIDYNFHFYIAVSISASQFPFQYFHLCSSILLQ